MRSELTSGLALLLLVAGAVALVSGRIEPRPMGPLPDALALVVESPGGGYESAVVQLSAPGEGPVVRRTPGIVALGPGWAHHVVVSHEVDPGGRDWHRLEVRDLSGEAEPYGLSLEEPPRVHAVHEGGVVVSSSLGLRFLAPDGRSREATSVEASAGGRLRFKGPGAGFRVHTGPQVRLQLPMQTEDEAVDLGLSGERLLGSWWFRAAELPAWEQELIRQVFKQEAAIPTSSRPVVVDGDLSEWREVRALTVNQEAQVIDGLDYWAGERDGAFGVAAQATEAALLLAVRVRDDALVPGRDRLELELEGRALTVLLADAPGVVEGEGWRAVFAPPAAHGISLELEVARRGQDRPEGLPRVAVHFVDHDPDQGTTRLATAAVGARLGG